MTSALQSKVQALPDSLDPPTTTLQRRQCSLPSSIEAMKIYSRRSRRSKNYEMHQTIFVADATDATECLKGKKKMIQKEENERVRMKAEAHRRRVIRGAAVYSTNID